MTESNETIGNSKAALVCQDEDQKAVVVKIMVRRVRQSRKRLRFVGTVQFSRSIKNHIRRILLPVVDQILQQLKLQSACFEISVINISAASVLDIGLRVSGFSADVPALIAMLSAALQIPVDDSFVSTGHIASTEGDIRTVRSIPAKLEAAINDGSVECFVYGDPETDSSLKVLSPNERNRSIDAIMAVGNSIRTVAVGNIGQLIKMLFTEENILLASLKEGFFSVSIAPNQFSGHIQEASTFLANNDQKRFWGAVHRYFINRRYEEGKELLKAYALFFIRREEYPAGFGAKLLHFVHSLPAAVRPKKIFPILDKGLCKQLSGSASENDYDDIPFLFNAAYGTNIASRVDIRPTIEQLEIKVQDADCVVFDTIVANINERALAQHLNISIDSRRASFAQESSVVETFEEFIDVIVTFFIHLQDFITCTTDKSEDMTRIRSEAIALQERTFRDKGGTKGAFARARDGIKGGMRTVLDDLTEQYKAEKKEAYIELVFSEAIEALDWNERVRCIRGLIKRIGQCLPKEFRNQPPERFARNYKSILRIYVKSMDNVDRFLRTM